MNYKMVTSKNIVSFILIIIFIKVYYMDNKIKVIDSKKIKKIKEQKKKWRHSENGYKSHRIDQWKHKYGIICDYQKIYEIFMNTNSCDYCNIELDSIMSKKLSGKSRCLDHCHGCGAVRGILCNICNLQNKLKCDLCDEICESCNQKIIVN